MRDRPIVIALLFVAVCTFPVAAQASATRPIIYSKSSWEWIGPERERHAITRGGLFATVNAYSQQLTDDPRDREPSVSRDGSGIVFVRNGDLFALHADGSGMRQLTSGPELDERPRISPNGSYVLLVRRSSREGPGDLYTIPLAGGQPQALAPFPGEDREASFSPDGRAIVFVRSLPVSGSAQTNEELFSVSPDGSGVTRLTSTPVDETRPHYFLKGIVFNRRQGAKGGQAAIYAMRRNGTQVKAVLTWQARFQPSVQAVSPNGELLVFSTLTDGTWVKRLVGLNQHSLSPRHLARWTAERLVFSPDGRWVAGTFRNTSSEVGISFALASIKVATGSIRYEGEFWEPEEPGPRQTDVGSWIAW